jgi:hypothetical protein
MKTKFALFVIFNVCIYGISFCQNTGGESPDSLSITFIDTTQNLQVNGSIVVDSSLTVKDSVIMEDNLHVYEKLTLEKDALLRENVYVGNSLQVAGESYSNGDAYFNQKVILNNLDAIDSLAFEPTNDEAAATNQLKVVFINAEGVLEKGNSSDLQSMVYFGKACNEVIGADGVPYMVETPPDPTWQNGPNKLFLAECPNLAKVGIGTSNPTHKLHTVGNVLFTKTLQVDGNVAIGTQPSSFSMLKIKNPGASAGIEVDMSTNTVDYQKLLYMRYAHEETELIKVENASTGHVPFILESSGRLVISNETERILQLETSGLLRARRIRVDADSWADFVFDKNYKLLALTELESFITNEKHLPNVPSEKEVIQNGVDLLEMNKILLQKVEELTLYLIDHNKQLQAQKIKIEELEETLKN